MQQEFALLSLFATNQLETLTFRVVHLPIGMTSPRWFFCACRQRLRQQAQADPETNHLAQYANHSAMH